MAEFFKISFLFIMFYFMSAFLSVTHSGKAAAALSWECSILRGFIMFFSCEIVMTLLGHK